MLFHSFIVKSNIFSRNSSILAASSIQVFLTQYCFHSEIQCLLQQFQHSSCKYYSNLSTFSTMLFHFFIRKSNTFLQQSILALFPFSFFYFDYGELSRELGNLHRMIRSLILLVVPIWKHFNFLARPYSFILYVSCEIKKSPQHIFGTPNRTHLCET